MRFIFPYGNRSVESSTYKNFCESNPRSRKCLEVLRTPKKLASWLVPVLAALLLSLTSIPAYSEEMMVVPLSFKNFACAMSEGKKNEVVQIIKRDSNQNPIRVKKVRLSQMKRTFIRDGKQKFAKKLGKAANLCKKMKVPQEEPPPPPSQPTPTPTPESTPPFPGRPDAPPTNTPTPDPTPTDEVCLDGIDNDLDSAIDMEDTDCQNLGVTYYISESLGNDAWSGLLPIPNGAATDGPKRSLAAAETILRNEAEPGDQVLLRRGDVWQDHTAATTVFRLSNIQGTPEAPIVFGAYGTAPQRPKLDIGGTLTIIVDIGGDSKYLLIRDLHLTTTAPLGMRPQGVRILNCTNNVRPEHIVLDGLEISDLRYGLTLQSNYLTLKNSIIRNNYKSGPDEQGGHTQGLYAGKQCGGGGHITIEGNVFDNNGAKESTFDWNVYLSCTDCSFENNYVTDGSSGLKIRNTTNVSVRNNIFEDINSVGISVGSDGGTTSQNVTIQDNLIRRTFDGITITRQSIGAGLMKDLTIINNMFMDNLPRPGGGGDHHGYLLFSANNAHENVLVANNTFYNIRYKAALQVNLAPSEGPEDQTNVRLVNNILNVTDSSHAAVRLRGDSLDPITLDLNLYDADRIMQRDSNVYHTTMAEVRAVFPTFEPHGFAGDAGLSLVSSSLGQLPMLESSSDAIGAAQCLSQVPGDFFGNSRPQNGCDTGAEERR